MDQVLWLEALFQACCFLLEVPSGYVSDRFGRRKTLLVAAGAGLGYALSMGMATQFVPFALAKVLLAIQFSFQSGTAVAYHAEILDHLGKGEELGVREAKLQSDRLKVSAITALTGGLFGAIDLRISFLLYGLVQILALWSAAGFLELQGPSQGGERAEENRSVWQALKECLALLKSPFLLWASVAWILRMATDHLPYNFYQPYLELLAGKMEAPPTAPLAGVHVAISMAFGSLLASQSERLAKALGFTRLVLVGLFGEILLTVFMYLWMHPFVLVALEGREFANGLIRPTWSARVVPRVPREIRATFLSSVTLAGRFCVALLVALMSVEAGQETGHAALRTTLFPGLLCILIGWLLLALFPPRAFQAEEIAERTC